MPTVNDLAQILMRETDESTDNTDMTSVVEQWISDSLDEYASLFDWRIFKQTGTINALANTPSYDLLEHVREIRAMRFRDTNEPIEYLDAQRMYEMGMDLEQVAKPQFWFWLEGEIANNSIFTIQLVPIPDASYTIDFLGIKHPVLTTPLTSAYLPVQQDVILCLKDRVRAYIAASDSNYDAADRFYQAFISRVQRMAERESAPKAGQLRLQVRDLPRSGDRRLARLDPTHFS